jgi:hypothetical protein
MDCSVMSRSVKSPASSRPFGVLVRRRRRGPARGSEVSTGSRISLSYEVVKRRLGHPSCPGKSRSDAERPSRSAFIVPVVRTVPACLVSTVVSRVGLAQVEEVEMSRWRLLESWDRDLPGLTDAQLRDRLRLATEHESRAARSGMGHNPKGRRAWRLRHEAVEVEMETRGLT